LANTPSRRTRCIRRRRRKRVDRLELCWRISAIEHVAWWHLGCDTRARERGMGLYEHEKKESMAYPISPSERKSSTLGLRPTSYCCETRVRMNVVPLLLLPRFRTPLSDALSIWKSTSSSQVYHASPKLVDPRHVELTLTEAGGARLRRGRRNSFWGAGAVVSRPAFVP
jgi:hypothetical protein